MLLRIRPNKIHFKALHPLVLLAGLSVFSIVPAIKLLAEESGPPWLKVEGNQLKTSSGGVVNLHGVNMPGLERSQGENLSKSLSVALEWHANIIRLLVSQDRWFGYTPEKKDGGVYYRKTVRDFVEQSAAARCYVMLDLHSSDAGLWGQYIGQHKMPDTNSVVFWESVAETFANNSAVLFNFYNEPHDVSWDVWRNGGKVSEESKSVPGGKLEYDTPGMQKLLEACRAKGAKNVVVIGGLDRTCDLTGVTNGYALDDANGNGAVYDTHIWDTSGNTKSQEWDRTIMSAGEKYPVVIGEFGDGKGNYQVLEFANRHHLPWMAWCMHPRDEPCLIKDWNYTPTEYGEFVKAALLQASAK